LWTLGLVTNVFIQLVGIWHVCTSKIHGCSSADHVVMQCILQPSGS
jgi:predicted membrane protein